ncbi:MAG: CopD family protein [Deltaproteobacteria bacterium]|nr:CopD family protein [Deltaproteobacteria bacterium]
MDTKFIKHLRISFILLPAFIIHLASIPCIYATEDYAAETRKDCAFCHQEPAGGELNAMGFAYVKAGYRYPIPERILEKSASLQTPFHKTLRFVIGYLHLLAAVVFFGAIFYIHLFIKPSRLIGGIPKHERILGVSCMITLALTGSYLTWVRIDSWEQFFNSTFGLMLFIKILLFVLMVAIGITAITVVHRLMGKEAKPVEPPHKEADITLEDLRHFDGAPGRPAYVAYEGKIYDVGSSPKWKEGRHFGKHSAGTDLTEAMGGAPHGAEVLENVRYVRELSEQRSAAKRPTPAHKVFIVMAYINLVIIFLVLGCISVWRWGFPVRLVPNAGAGVSARGTCIECHMSETPGIYHGWSNSLHAKVNVGCLRCHKPGHDTPVISERHLQYDIIPVSLVVTPKTCQGCHPKEVDQYDKSKHAHTLEIMWKVDNWLNDGMNNAIERTTGCYACHGTVVEVVDGRPKPGTWPNVGVGRKNPDDTLGSCSSCHTRHRFSVVEARKPEACDQCHLGPDHPQIEIYNESKHGTIYHAEGNEWNWRPDDGRWKAGSSYRAPTCAACHISEADDMPATHDVTERLSWETQAPLTVRPNEFKPFPAKTDWKRERTKMKRVCLQCHSIGWTDDHFSNLDRVIENYNENYFKPIKNLIDSLYRERFLSRESYFDEDLEWEFYELWHHDGRRARMGAAMMAPDYAWWHGFYELKHRYIHIRKAASDLRQKGIGHIHRDFPGKFQEE